MVCQVKVIERDSAVYNVERSRSLSKESSLNYLQFVYRQRHVELAFLNFGVLLCQTHKSYFFNAEG